MDDEEEDIFPFNPEPEPIPREFYSEYEERPFRSCTRCGETLADFVEGYQVAKIYRRGEVVFEYALCGPCHTGLVEEFSEESRQTLEAYYAENMTPGLGAETCGICEKTREELGEPEFALGGACHGSSLIEAFMICAGCMEKTNALVSKKTQGIWGDFINDNFPGVPADFLPDPAGIPVF